MRMQMSGFEIASLTDRGWTESGAGGHFFDGASRHLSPSGNGGARSISLGSAVTNTKIESPTFSEALVEHTGHVALSRSGITSAIEFRSGSTLIADIQINGSAQVEIRVGGSLEDTSTETLTAFSFELLSWRYRMLDAGGIFEVFLNDDLTTPVASFSGDTKPGAETTIDNVRLSDDDGSNFDDYAINALTMRYDGGSGGVPAAGETITGGTSGATAKIGSVEAGSDATTGRLFLHTLSGTFQDNEAITSSGTMNAVNDSPAAQTAGAGSVAGLEANSGIPSTLGFQLLQNPDSDGQFTELTAVPGGGNNYLEVDDWDSAMPADSDNRVEGGSDGLRDFYGTQDGSSGFTGVNCVEAILWAARQGTVINNIQPGVGDGSSQAYGAAQALTPTFEEKSEVFDTNPLTGVSWVTGDIAALEVGARVLT